MKKNITSNKLSSSPWAPAVSISPGRSTLSFILAAVVQLALILILMLAAIILAGQLFPFFLDRRSLLAAAALCYLTGLFSFLPIVWCFHRRRCEPMTALASTVLRLILTLITAALYGLWVRPHLTQFVIWLVLSYLTILGWETWQTVKLLRRLPLPAPEHDNDY